MQSPATTNNLKSKGGITVRALGVIAIRCVDLGAMVAFYRDVIGLEPMRDPKDAPIVFFRVAGGFEGHTTVLALFRHDLQGAGWSRADERPPATGPGSSLHHIAPKFADLFGGLAQIALPPIAYTSMFISAYIFESVEHAERFWNSDVARKIFDEIAEKANVRILNGMVYYGTRQLSLTDNVEGTVTTPADLKGVKLRMANYPAWIALGEALGADPTPVAFNETYLAMQTGTVDGQDNGLTVLTDTIRSDRSCARATDRTPGTKVAFRTGARRSTLPVHSRSSC